MSTCIGVSIGIPFSRVLGGFTGLLDEYPNAAAAYSLRKLRNLYAGSAIRVRRSSDNAEQDIGFVNNVLDTASLLTFCGAGNGFVVTWYDQSGNARNVTQTTAINQPQIVSSGSVLLDNSKPCIFFDGVNDRLITASNFTEIEQPFSTFSTSKENNTTRALFGATTSTSPYRWAELASVNKYALFNGTVISSGIDVITTQKILATIHNGASSRLRLNETLSIAINPNTEGCRNIQIGGYFGTTQLLEGNFQEFILYPTNQFSNLSDISDNLNDFYEIY